MTIDRPNLASAFTAKPTVDRAAALTGLLPAPRSKPSTPSATSVGTTPDTSTRMDAVDQPVRDPDRSRSGTASTGQKTTSSPRTIRAEKPADTASTPISATADIVANVAVYLEPELPQQVRAARQTSGDTYDQLVVTAFEQLNTEALRAQFQPAGNDISASGMPLRRRRIRGTAGIQIQLRLTGRQRIWLEQQQEQVGAPSRSALIAAALRQHLTR